MTWSNLGKAAALAAICALLSAASVAAEDARGRELINSLGCKGCHQFEGSGGTLAPALDGTGKRLDAEQIKKQLTEPGSINPNTMMPSYAHLPEDDLQILISFLENLK
ncbi:cytochrome c [Geoalkalibacter halelectricus]|uniref:Cytochrome c n=1 Tax=Geoalkalibacter halelectricus TaxID=2847045 RepID=A0ABY5ZSL1_9BACT|nr:cytochrome c [Geoalkalibacter halelectricus]MDO3377380.1 cytochrome c [Geoalkalibacter halelectricus]UWZ80855.1 cytochrome c [Geoalkalibacter halelectricus]